MDQQLLAWGLQAPRGTALPRIWLFTDDRRLPNPVSAISRLPRGRAGVVFRHDAAADRAAIGRRIARICRERRLVLVVTGDARLAAALHAGVHLRGGIWPGVLRPHGLTTSSAHSAAELHRAARAGAGLAFLSPTFRSESHPGVNGLGAVRWGLAAGRAPRGIAFGALGGVTGRGIRRLPTRRCQAAGAIGALAE